MEKTTERDPEDRYKDLLKIFPFKPNIKDVYKIDVEKIIGSGG